MNKRKRFFANNIHKDLYLFIVCAALVPASITAVCMFYLIFNMITHELGIPEGVAYYVIPAAKKVTAIMLVTVPIALLVILYLAHTLTLRIAGPIDRLIKEIDQVTGGSKKDTLHIRQGDRLQPLVDSINKLITKLLNRTTP